MGKGEGRKGQNKGRAGSMVEVRGVVPTVSDLQQKLSPLE